MNACILRAAAIGIAAAGAWAQAPAEPVRMNQIQVIGTHNSYHAGIAPSETELWKRSKPDQLRSLEYRHAPLDAQLSAGVRQIELDIFADSRGGRYANPAGPRLVAQAGLPQDPPFDPLGVMGQPGFKVMHVPDVDYRSTCLTLVGCLQIVRDWSRQHAGHLPIFILIETKQTPEKSDMPITVPEKFTAETLDALDAEIRSVFGREEMIVPDDVRGLAPHFGTGCAEGRLATDRARPGESCVLDGPEGCKSGLPPRARGSPRASGVHQQRSGTPRRGVPGAERRAFGTDRRAGPARLPGANADRRWHQGGPRQCYHPPRRGSSQRRPDSQHRLSRLGASGLDRL